MENKRLKFIIIYGLQGSGKTSLCKKVVQEVLNVTYMNIGADEKFKVDETVTIAKRLFNSNTHVITEGIFPNINYRKCLCKEFNKTHDYICIYLYETLKNLSNRRNRTEHEYWQLLKTMQVLYLPPTDIILNEPVFEKRVEFVKNLLK